MNATLRATLGWIAAVLLNAGALLFVVGLLFPRTGAVPVATVGLVLLGAGLATGVAWLAGGRGTRR